MFFCTLDKTTTTTTTTTIAEKQVVAPVLANNMPVPVDFFNKVSSIPPQLWNGFINKHLQHHAASVYLSLAYLQAYENAHPNVQTHYAICHKDNKPLAIACFKVHEITQILHYSNDELQKAKNAPIRNRLISFVNKLSFRILVGGNLYITGDNGFYAASCLQPSEIASIQTKMVNWIQAEQKRTRKPINLILLKDALQKQPQEAAIFKASGLNYVKTHPNMVLQFRQNWKSFDDYLAAMSSKYRVRAKRYLKDGQELHIAELSLTDLETFKTPLYQLYRNVADKAELNLAVATPNYLSETKKALEQQLRVIGYWKNNKELVGFISFFIHNGLLEAHMIGYDISHNKEEHLYPFILTDLIREAFKYGATFLSFGRTASEIKSATGAVPQSIGAYVKHTNLLLNKIVPLLVRCIRQNEWVQRHPFKKEVGND